ncbi:hypothetical protein BDR26DRAFT_1012470 [Obelidium mucronatum]|nr:hypothetical protein BDR26DRAFT_1012470 [Obelidium mucronatum]
MQQASDEWSILRIDSPSIGSNIAIEQLERLVRATIASAGHNKRTAIVVSSIKIPRTKSCTDRLIEAASHCLGIKQTRRNASNTSAPQRLIRTACQHQPLISSLERDLIQLIRRSIRDPKLGEDAEAYVGETLRGVREFLSAIEIVGEMSPSSLDALISAGDNMAAFILTCALQASGFPAKLMPTDSLVSPSFTCQNMDDELFTHVISNLTRRLQMEAYSSNEADEPPVIPVFSGAFGSLPSHLALSTHLPQKQHTSLFASLLTLSLANFSCIPPTLYLLHTHISGIHSIDPRVSVSTGVGSCSANVSRQIKNVDVNAAIEICGVGSTGGLLSRAGLELVFGAAPFGAGSGGQTDNNSSVAESGGDMKVYLGRIRDIDHELSLKPSSLSSNEVIPTVDFGAVVQSVGTRIVRNGSVESETSNSIVIYKNGVVVLRIDRILESSSGPSADAGDNAATTLLLESHRILGFVFSVLDECGVRVCTSSSSYRTVTVAVVEEGFESTSGGKGDDDSLSRTSSAASFAGGFKGDPTPVLSAKSNLQKAIEKLQVLKATISVYPNKGIISLINTNSNSSKDGYLNRNIGVELTRKLLNALSKPRIHIEMCSQGVGAVGVSVVVNEDQVYEGVRAVHEAVYCGN